MALVIGLILIVNIVIALDIPFLRQYLGAIFYSLVPGWLILNALKLARLGSTEKLVLSVGLSLAFLIFAGFAIDKAYFAIGYATPLAAVSLVITFDVILIALAIAGYITNRNAFALAIPGLDTRAKAFLVLPALLPLLSISGMYLMNNTSDNRLLMVMLFLIAAYVSVLAILDRRVPSRIYPATIFLVGLSLTLMLGLRSSYIVGLDTHYEYFLFRMTVDNLHWNVIIDRALDSALSISLLPAVYHSLLGGSEQYLFKLLYPFAFSVCPLAVYVIARRHIRDLHAFLAAAFFMSQISFIRAEFFARTATAVLFFALAVMVIFSDRIVPAKRNALLILFSAGVIVSHYSVGYIFLFIMAGTWLLASLLRLRHAFRRRLSLSMTLLLLAMVFLWYARLTGFETGYAFITPVNFIQQTLVNLSQFLVLGLRAGEIQTVLGQGLVEKGIPSMMQVALTWVTFGFIGTGVLAMLVRYREFEGDYLALVLVGSAAMVAAVVTPYLSVIYGPMRTYNQLLVVLAPFFVTGGVWLANRLRVNPSLWLCLVLVPYFLSVTGVTYQLGKSAIKDVSLNSDGDEYYQVYVHDQEVYAAQWLEANRVKVEREEIFKKGLIIYGDGFGMNRLASQGEILKYWLNGTHLWSLKEQNIPYPVGVGYIYLDYDNIVNGRMYFGRYYDLAEFKVVFQEMRRVYANGGSEIWN